MRLTVTYRTTDEERGFFELNDSKDLNLLLEDRWFKVQGKNTGRLYFACPREHVVSVKEH